MKCNEIVSLDNLNKFDAELYNELTTNFRRDEQNTGSTSLR